MKSQISIHTDEPAKARDLVKALMQFHGDSDGKAHVLVQVRTENDEVAKQVVMLFPGQTNTIRQIKGEVKELSDHAEDNHLDDPIVELRRQMNKGATKEAKALPESTGAQECIAALNQGVIKEEVIRRPYVKKVNKSLRNEKQVGDKSLTNSNHKAWRMKRENGVLHAVPVTERKQLVCAGDGGEITSKRQDAYLCPTCTGKHKPQRPSCLVLNGQLYGREYLMSLLEQHVFQPGTRFTNAKGKVFAAVKDTIQGWILSKV
jgi:hypothetical protein